MSYDDESHELGVARGGFTAMDHFIRMRGELARRRNVYPFLVERGRMRRDAANDGIAWAEALVRWLEDEAYGRVRRERVK